MVVELTIAIQVAVETERMTCPMNKNNVVIVVIDCVPVNLRCALACACEHEAKRIHNSALLIGMEWGPYIRARACVCMCSVRYMFHLLDAFIILFCSQTVEIFISIKKNKKKMYFHRWSTYAALQKLHFIAKLDTRQRFYTSRKVHTLYLRYIGTFQL